MRVTKSRCIAEYTAATQYTDKEVKQNNYKGILSHLMGSKTSRSDPKRGAAKADTANRERQNEQRKGANHSRYKGMVRRQEIPKRTHWRY